MYENIFRVKIIIIILLLLTMEYIFDEELYLVGSLFRSLFEFHNSSLIYLVITYNIKKKKKNY